MRRFFLNAAFVASLVGVVGFSAPLGPNLVRFPSYSQKEDSSSGPGVAKVLYLQGQALSIHRFGHEVSDLRSEPRRLSWFDELSI